MLQMQSRDYAVIAIAPEDQYSSEFIKNGIEFISIKLNRKGYNIFNGIHLIAQLHKIYRRVCPEIIHHFTIKPVIFGSIAARLANNSKIINSITGLGYAFQQGWLFKKITKWIYKLSLNSPKIKNIFQNPDDMSEFISHKISYSNNSHLIRSSGVDISKFEHIRYTPPISKMHFLFLSRMLIDKGLYELKDAISLLSEKNSNFILTLAGEIDVGNPQSVSKAWMKKAFDSHFCEWIGYEDDIVSLFEEANVVILPSYHEGLPHCLIEALAASKPIITTDMPGCREVIHENGILIQPKDATALFRAMHEMINTDKLKLWSENSFRLESKFDINVVNQQTLTVYGINK
jgi:glycosyltransferase involved in cell wall biosynthesis